MKKSKGFFAILIPGATVFFSSACIMVLELVAGRLIAKHLGSSIYTWTSVIGVVLAGITIGNYLGGRIADRFPARKTLAVLFGISSIACVTVIALNNLVGNWILLWFLSWPARVLSHVCLVFLIPSTLLGTISPVVAKMALDKGLATGRTIGSIYAWGAAGSILGTFLAGFYLIATMGTIAIIWTIAAVMLLMAILYWTNFWALYVWAAILIALMAVGLVPADWARKAGSSFALRELPNPSILYEDESQYCYIMVKRASEKPDTRTFHQDKLLHSEIVMDDINNLQYFYTRIYADITEDLGRNKNKFSAMAIGGGGYVFPRYLEKNWPGSHIDVVEIDPAVTKAAIQAFGLKKDTPINTITMDARNYVEQLLERKYRGLDIPRYDFIYGDAFNDYSVPYQLVTKEFNDKIAQILSDDGVYLVNLIDIFDSGLFLGSIINTFQKIFSNVYIISEITPLDKRQTFVVIASKKEINIESIIRKSSHSSNIWYLNNEEISSLKQKSRGLILTDDYVPVETLLAPVVRDYAVYSVLVQCRDLAQKLRRQGKIDESIAVYEEIVKIMPSLLIYQDLVESQIQQGRLNDAVRTFQQAIQYGEKPQVRYNIANIHLDFALLLKQLNRPEEAKVHFYKAIDGFRKELSRSPESIKAVFKIGIALAEVGKLSEAIDYLKQALKKDPADMLKHVMLAQAFITQKNLDLAAKQLHESIQFMSQQGRKNDAETLQKILESIESKK